MDSSITVPARRSESPPIVLWERRPARERIEEIVQFWKIRMDTFSRSNFIFVYNLSKARDIHQNAPRAMSILFSGYTLEFRSFRCPDVPDGSNIAFTACYRWKNQPNWIHGYGQQQTEAEQNAAVSSLKLILGTEEYERINNLTLSSNFVGMDLNELNEALYEEIGKNITSSPPPVAASTVSTVRPPTVHPSTTTTTNNYHPVRPTGDNAKISSSAINTDNTPSEGSRALFQKSISGIAVESVQSSTPTITKKKSSCPLTNIVHPTISSKPPTTTTCRPTTGDIIKDPVVYSRPTNTNCVPDLTSTEWGKWSVREREEYIFDFWKTRRRQTGFPEIFNLWSFRSLSKNASFAFELLFSKNRSTRKKFVTFKSHLSNNRVGPRIETTCAWEVNGQTNHVVGFGKNINSARNCAGIKALKAVLGEAEYEWLDCMSQAFIWKKIDHEKLLNRLHWIDGSTSTAQSETSVATSNGFDQRVDNITPNFHQTLPNSAVSSRRTTQQHQNLITVNTSKNNFAQDPRLSRRRSTGSAASTPLPSVLVSNNVPIVTSVTTVATATSSFSSAPAASVEFPSAQRSVNHEVVEVGGEPCSKKRKSQQKLNSSTKSSVNKPTSHDQNGVPVSLLTLQKKDPPFLPFDDLIGIRLPSNAASSLRYLFSGRLEAGPSFSTNMTVKAECCIGCNYFEAFGPTECEAKNSVSVLGLEHLLQRKI